MGAPLEDYQRLAPPYSFIHVDSFKSPKELAEYLNVLDNDDDLYNRWVADDGDILLSLSFSEMRYATM